MPLWCWTACDITLNPETPAQDSSQEFRWHYFRGSVYVGDILSYESEMQEAITELFPHYEGMDEDFAQIGVDLNYASIESDEYYPLLHCYNGYAQGKDEKSATVSISTLDADELRS